MAAVGGIVTGRKCPLGVTGEVRDRAAAKLIDGALRSLLPVREIPVMAGTLEALDRLCDVRGADAPAVTTGVSETTIPEGDENS